MCSHAHSHYTPYKGPSSAPDRNIDTYQRSTCLSRGRLFTSSGAVLDLHSDCNIVSPHFGSSSPARTLAGNQESSVDRRQNLWPVRREIRWERQQQSSEGLCRPKFLVCWLVLSTSQKIQSSGNSRRENDSTRLAWPQKKNWPQKVKIRTVRLSDLDSYQYGWSTIWTLQLWTLRSGHKNDHSSWLIT